MHSTKFQPLAGVTGYRICSLNDWTYPEDTGGTESTAEQ